MEITPELEQLLTDKIADALGTAKTEILADVHKANQGLATSLSKEIKKLQPEAATADGGGDDTNGEKPDDTAGQKLTLKALQTQLAELQSERERERQETLEAKRNSALTQAIASTGALNQKALYRLFLADHGGNIQQEGDQWFLKSGDDTVVPLESAVTKFLTTEEGKFFVAPSGVNGAGSTETKSTTSNPPVTYGSRLEQMTAELASGEAKLAI